MTSMRTVGWDSRQALALLEHVAVRTIQAGIGRERAGVFVRRSSGVSVNSLSVCATPVRAHRGR